MFLPVFDILSGLPLGEMKTLLPVALTGLIGKVKMTKAVNAFLNFFNSSATDGECLIDLTGGFHVRRTPNYYKFIDDDARVHIIFFFGFYSGEKPVRATNRVMIK